MPYKEYLINRISNNTLNYYILLRVLHVQHLNITIRALLAQILAQVVEKQVRFTFHWPTLYIHIQIYVQM